MDEATILGTIKWALFNESLFDPELEFVSWCNDGNSFIAKDKDGSEFRIIVRRE